MSLKSPLRILQTDFRTGEIDPLIYMRVDSKAYPGGARSLKNMLVYNTGAASRRPGMTNIASLSGRRRLWGYEFDVDEKYILAFGNNALEIYDIDGGTAVDTFSGTTDCPWDATEAWELDIATQGDTIIITHPSFLMKVLTRTGLDTFSMADFAFTVDADDIQINQPHYKFEGASVTLAVSSTAVGTGVTLTASSAIFSSAWVGDRIRVFEGELEVTGYTSTTVLTVSVLKEVRRKLIPNPFRYTQGDATVEVTMAYHGLSDGDSVTISGAEGGNGILSSEINGTRTITVQDQSHFTVEAASNATDSVETGGASVYVTSTAGTRDWTEQAFSDRRGYPGACTFYDNRLYLAGSTEIPNGLWGSVVGVYFNFDVMEGEDDASIQVSISLSRMSRIKHLVPSRQLQIFTDGMEVVCEAASGTYLTPANFKASPQTSYGISDVHPGLFDGATIFVQSNNRTIREFVYEYQIDGFAAGQISTTADHLISSPQDMAVLYGTTTRPEQYAFIVNDDGTVAVFHSIRQEGLAAWTPMETDSSGSFDSVCVIGSSVLFSVLRGSTYFLERFELDSTTIWLDNAKSMSGASSTTWALGSDYASKTVDVMSNGHYLGQYTANGSGTITLSEAVTSIVAGYDYGIEVIPNAPDKELRDGAITGRKRRIVSAIMHFDSTVAVSVNGIELIGTGIGDDVTTPPNQESGKKTIRLFGFDRDPAITLTQANPGPMTILGLNQEVSI